VGFDLDFDYVKPYVHESGLRIFTGIKYYRITGHGLGRKEPYNEKAALEKAAEHAGNFMFNREKQAEHLAGIMDRPPLIVSPYDAELFGHWWYEGPEFLAFLFRKIHYDQENIKTITPSEYLQGFPKNQIATPSLSSWGYKGYCEVWLEGSNDWLYRHLHAAARRMIELANRHRQAGGLLERALKQAARELLLAQSSDWAFIMKTRTMVDYAVQRTKQHLLNFNALYSQIMKNDMKEAYIADLEYRHNIFPEIDYTLYAD
jgi:1,4-alpha-glucan branching enzyme